MSPQSDPENRRFGLREWMGDGWWAALILSLAMIFIVRSGTVGAPTQASANSMDRAVHMTERLRTNSPQKAALERELRASARELAVTRDALEAAKERVAVLQESYDGLDDQFSQMTERVRSSALFLQSASAEVGATPVPMEATFTTKPAPTEGEPTSK